VIYESEKELEKSLETIPEEIGKQGHYFHEVVIEIMAKLRKACDELEVITPKEMWPFPTYGDLLFSIR
jgi:glutamine synthetase